MEDESREERVERYYHEGARDLAGRLVDAEDEIENYWKPRVRSLEHRLAGLER